MSRCRTYGRSPYRVIVVHGGPGAAGEMASVARELSKRRGVLEPFQTATTIKGQVEGLRGAIEGSGDPPVTLIGFSWGAWLGFIMAAKYPAIVGKLILVGSGSFTEEFAVSTLEVRLSRLTNEERKEYLYLLATLEGSAAEDEAASMQRLGKLSEKADSFDAVESELDRSDIEIRPEVYRGVWPEAAAMRRSGALLALGRGIACPVVAIHGDYDPHPAAGVEGPLAGIVRDFRFILLEKCGHKPWIERHAKAEFYRVLEEEIQG